jgi:2-polyprenyl-3-methyl-5-hydroxy-6-metoxy-1,4-benzoquinol methylase
MAVIFRYCSARVKPVLQNHRPHLVMTELQNKWDARYRAASTMPRPARVLEENAHLLPGHGTALDLACGLGANALTLARAGLQVDAWDISSVAIAALTQQAEREGLAIRATVRDVLAEPPPAQAYDVIVVSHFLQRELAPALYAALRPGGLLYYQTFVRDKVDDVGPSNADYLLAENELRDLFAELCLRVYREEGRLGDSRRGLRNEALLVGQKPVSPARC